MTTLTQAHSDRLSLAVAELNAAMAQIMDDCGDAVRVRPWANYSSDEGIAYIEVEVTTGVQRFGQPR